MVGILNGFIRRVTAFATSALPKLLELIFEGALAMAGSARRTGDGHRQEGRKRPRQDPCRSNRLCAPQSDRSGEGGVGQFAGNVLTHLKNGLFAWLTGSLEGVIKLPEKWNLAGIVTMIAEFLGLTWSRLRTLLVGRLGGPSSPGSRRPSAGSRTWPPRESVPSPTRSVTWPKV